jgi:uncharacterized protein YjbI with pentapeptide repeats
MAVETYNIIDRFTGAVLFSAEIECAPHTLPNVKLGLAIKFAVKSGADLGGADLSGAYLIGSNLSRANLSQADLSGADLSGADLSGADLSGADLSGAYLSGADLSRANLSQADLSGADLSRANLSQADLSGSNLSRADLSRADLGGADLSGADLSGADLSGAKIRIKIAQVRRDDGYEFIAFDTDIGVMVKAGCRWFSMPDFRAHVAAKYPDTPKAAETLAILDFIDIRAAALGCVALEQVAA